MKDKNSNDKAMEYLKKFEETKKLSYLRRAIKIDYQLIWNDDARWWLEHLYSIATIPYPGKLGFSTNEVREFFEDLKLIKPDKWGESNIFFGSGYRMESCLGVRFSTDPKWELIVYNSAVLFHFVEKLKESWKDFCKSIDKKRFKIEEKGDKVREFCQMLGLEVVEKEIAWGSVAYDEKIAITIVGIMNLKRWKAVLDSTPSHHLNKVFNKFPYFKFRTLENFYENRIKNKVESSRLSDVEKNINAAQKDENPFVIRIEGEPTPIIKVRNPRKL